MKVRRLLGEQPARADISELSIEEPRQRRRSERYHRRDGDVQLRMHDVGHERGVKNRCEPGPDGCRGEREPLIDPVTGLRPDYLRVGWWLSYSRPRIERKYSA